MTTPVVTCDAVRRAYRRGRGAPTVVALDDVSVAIESGELVGITGASGSGKSTLLHLLAGLDTPDSGRVTIAGHDVGGLPERARARIRLEHVGIVFQRFHLLPALSARANVALPLIEQGVSKRERRERAMALLDRVGLDDRAGHKPGELSGGEQQRVAVARALVTEPALLIADEPTGELDSTTGRRIIDLLQELATDRAVVVASHDDAVVAAADRTLELRDGRLVDG